MAKKKTCNCDNCPICDSGSSGTSSGQGVSSGTGSDPISAEGTELLKQDSYATAAENSETIKTTSTPGTILMDVIANVQSCLPSVVNNIAEVVGFLCEIYYPFGTSSVYGKHDNKIRYTTYPQVRKCFIGANLFDQAPAGVFDGSEFSTFVGETPYLMTFNYRIPESSKVKIYYGSSSRWMKVRRHEEYPGSGGPLMILCYLSPCTSSGELIEDEPTPDESSTLVVDKANAEGTVKAGQNMI